MPSYLYSISPITTENFTDIRSALEAYECNSTQVFRRLRPGGAGQEVLLRISLSDSDKLLIEEDKVFLPRVFGSADTEDPLCVFAASLKQEDTLGNLESWAHLFTNNLTPGEKLQGKSKIYYDELYGRLMKLHELRTMIELEQIRLSDCNKQVTQAINLYVKTIGHLCEEALKPEAARIAVEPD